MSNTSASCSVVLPKQRAPILEKQHNAMLFVNSLQRLSISKGVIQDKEAKDKYFLMRYMTPGNMEHECERRYDEFQVLNESIRMTCTLEKDKCPFCSALYYEVTAKSFASTIMLHSKQKEAQLFLTRLVQTLQAQQAKTPTDSGVIPTNCAGKCYVPTIVENFFKSPKMTRTKPEERNLRAPCTIGLLIFTAM